MPVATVTVVKTKPIFRAYVPPAAAPVAEPAPSPAPAPAYRRGGCGCGR